jgi:hypothetical protein
MLRHIWQKNALPAAQFGKLRRKIFFDRIKHYINEGDTALHMAAEAKQTRIAEELISRAPTFVRGTGVVQNRFT